MFLRAEELRKGYTIQLIADFRGVHVIYEELRYYWVPKLLAYSTTWE